MRRYITNFTLLLALGFATLLQSQHAKNPFDLEGRAPTMVIEMDSTMIYTEEVENQEASPENAVVNPFDVSHIPIQTKDVKHKQKVKKVKKKPQASSIFDFKFWLIVLSCILFALLLSQSREKIFNLSKAIFNQNYLKILARDNNHGFSLLFVSLYILFFINGALFLFLVTRLFSDIMLTGSNYMLMLGCLVVLYLGKHIILAITGFIFPLSKATSTYSFSVVLFNSILGIILLCINILAIFGPSSVSTNLLYLGIGIIVLFFLYRVLSGIFLASKYITSHFFHFFLYLCTCEIAPLLIIYKILF